MFRLQFLKPQWAVSMVVNSILINLIPRRNKEQWKLKTKPCMSLRNHYKSSCCTTTAQNFPSVLVRLQPSQSVFSAPELTLPNLSFDSVSCYSYCYLLNQGYMLIRHNYSVISAFSFHVVLKFPVSLDDPQFSCSFYMLNSWEYILWRLPLRRPGFLMGITKVSSYYILCHPLSLLCIIPWSRTR